jgi:hypothetical protein
VECPVHSDHGALKRYIAKHVCGSVVFQSVLFDTSVISALLFYLTSILCSDTLHHATAVAPYGCGCCIRMCRLCEMSYKGALRVLGYRHGVGEVFWNVESACLGARFSVRYEIACNIHLAKCQRRKGTEPATCTFVTCSTFRRTVYCLTTRSVHD